MSAVSRHLDCIMSNPIFFLLLVGFCHLAISTDPDDEVQFPAQLHPLALKYIEMEADIKRERRVYDLDYAYELTFRPIGGFEPASWDEAVSAHDSHLASIAIAWWRLVSRILINIYKYHDLLDGATPLSMHTRFIIIHGLLKKNDSDIEEFMKKFDPEYVDGIPEFEDDGMGFISETKDPYEPLFSAIQKVREVLEIETDKLHFYVHHGATPLTERYLNLLLDEISENIGDVKEHIVRRIVPITRSEWNKLYEDLQKAFSKAKPDDTSLSCISLYDHYSHLMDDIQRNCYVELREMAAAPDINLTEFDEMRYDPIAYFPDEFDEVKERAEALHEAMRKGERLGYVVISDDRLERCQLKRMFELDPFIRPPSTSGTGPSNDPHSHHVYGVVSSHNSVPQPGIYTDGHNSGSRAIKRPYGTNGDTSGRGSGSGGERGSSSSSYYIGH
ncbi:hypothetical protein SeLEV6574_g03700 [Synchytrium endobioticum]|uniref:Uncharacterized protein n=1 Tax=Synchytrium endobioticum TaxID=286115 RepID=A0A507D2P3_9FUNG|nr:hypothetical protein SeLEV6574_g03700 [Synchytrium endobioticum]